MNGTHDRDVAGQASGVMEHPATINAGIIRELEAIVPGGVKTNVPLEQVSRWRVGGPARLVLQPRSAWQLQQVMTYVSRHQLPYVVLGSTSNLLFADEGIDVLVVQIGSALSGFQVEGARVRSEAGLWVPGFARQLALAGLTGAEHTCGIPGTLGGLICMNGGSQRKGIGDHLIDVVSVTPEGERRVRSRQECDFRYRHSVFQSLREIIVSARFRFRRAESCQSVRREMLGILAQRRRKFPRKLPNCGSVFVSDPAMYAEFGPPGAVIEQCGLKGSRVGGAMISPLHANFIVNHDHARALDILTLISLARCRVRDRTGYDMVAEVCYVSPCGDITPAHIKADELVAIGAAVTGSMKRS
ncbi:UDP-N-acetylmuramate dehydrogenase [Marinobacter lacisalsi]|uniref:UDP-N-acetylenolpyruvoylglucosamine reductase n=1 Tax=Marinobacter lacisalsi TaxID=475979 RepID=A0ABV8QPP5_9GAMM